MLDDDGKEVPGTRGYKYFGRARELPGVKEMFSKSSTSSHLNFSLCPSRSARADIRMRGYGDDGDIGAKDQD